MKILYLLHTSDLHGSTISILNLIRNSKDTVEAIILIPRGKDKALTSLLSKNGIKYYQCYRTPISAIAKHSSSLERIIYLIKLYIIKLLYILKLLYVIGIEKPALIHTNVGVIYEGYRLAKLFKIPHIWHLREYQDRDFKWNFLYGKKHFERMLQKSYVICITKDIKKYFNLNGPKAITIYNGIYKNSHITIEPKEKYFLCASRISPNKGQEDVIKAFAFFYKKTNAIEWKLIIAGNGEKEYIDYLKNLTIQLKCHSCVEFIGFQSSDSIFQLMTKASALIVASQNEGFGRMTAEACFAGTAIIGRYTGGTKEILDTIEGYSFLTIPELTSRLIEVSQIVNTNTYQAKIENSQNVARNLFSIEQNIINTLQFYKLALHGK